MALTGGRNLPPCHTPRAPVSPTEQTLFTFDRMLVEVGIILIKYWCSAPDEVQEERFPSPLDDPMRRWNLSNTDVVSITKWKTTRGRRMRCSKLPIMLMHRGGRPRVTTNAPPGRTRSATFCRRIRRQI